MTLYRVTWEIDLEAISPREAAETARSWLLEPGAECVIFGVTDISEGSPYPEIQNGELIDLMEYEDD